MAQVIPDLPPASWPCHLQDEAQPVKPLADEPAARPRPHIGCAQKQVEIAAEEDLRPLDVPRPFAQKLHILPVTGVLQRLQVMPAQVLGREVAASCTNTAGCLGDQQAHGRRRTGEVRIREINADGAGGAANRQAVVDQVRNVAGPAAANELGPEHAAPAAFEPGAQRRQILEPLHEKIRISGEVLTQVVERQDKSDRQALPVRVDKTSHVEPETVAAQCAVAQQQLIGSPFLRTDAEDFFDRAGRHVDYLLDALQEMDCFALIGEGLVALARDEMGGVPFRQEGQVRINRPAVRAGADDAALVPNQTLGGGTVEQGNPQAHGDLPEVMIVDRPEDGVAMAKRLGVAILHAQKTVAVASKEAALDQPAFPGKSFHSLRPEDFGTGQILCEVDAPGPVLCPGIRCSLDDGDGESCLDQADGRGQAGCTGADNKHIVVAIHFHGRSSCCCRLARARSVAHGANRGPRIPSRAASASTTSPTPRSVA